MKKIKSILFAAALIATAMFSTPAKAQTNMPPPLTALDYAGTNALGQIENYFTSFDTNSRTWADTTSIWIGLDYVSGLNVAQAIGIEHDFWQSASLKSSITNGTTLSGTAISGETVERNSGIAGTILTAGAGVGASYIKADLKVTAFAEAEYNFLLRKAGAELGLRAKKAIGTHAFGGVGLSFETYRTTMPTLDINTGFTL